MTDEPLDQDQADASAPPTYDPEPIIVGGAVAIVGEVRTHEDPNVFSAYTTIQWQGTELPQQILAEDAGRGVARILCSGTGPAYLGTLAQCQQAQRGNVQGGGYLLPTGATLEVTHRQALWAAPDGSHPVTLSIAVERNNPS
jgi:hypothetical protein